MKVLILSSRIPFPVNNGYALVVYNTVKGLLEQGAEVSLFCLNPTEYFVEQEDISNSILQKIDFQYVDVEVEPGFFDQFFRNLNLTNNVSKYFSTEAEKRLMEILHYDKFDIIQLEGILMVPYSETVMYQQENAKIIYRVHQLEYLVWQTASENEGFWPKKQYLKKLSQRLMQLTLEQFDRYDHIFTLTESDRFQIIQLGCKTSVSVAPIGLDLKQYIPTENNALPPTLFYLGTLEWLPNKEGLAWFLNNVWPFVEQLNNDIRLYLAGKNIEAELKDYDSENIVIEGEVIDAAEFMNSKSIMVVPLLSGSGIRVKIIEGMAMKKCIIATSKALEGINCRHGHDVLIAESIDDYFRMILHCVANPKLWKTIGENARKTVESHYELSKTTQHVLHTYDILSND